jgi:hypothetical protein
MHAQVCASIQSFAANLTVLYAAPRRLDGEEDDADRDEVEELFGAIEYLHVGRGV